MGKNPLVMGDEEYDEYIRAFPTAEARIMMALRESRYLQYWFPPYSSGSGDCIEQLMNDLRKEWGLPPKEWWWNHESKDENPPQDLLVVESKVVRVGPGEGEDFLGLAER